MPRVKHPIWDPFRYPGSEEAIGNLVPEDAYLAAFVAGKEDENPAPHHYG